MPFDFTHDYLFLHDLEAVTLRRISTPASDDVSVGKAAKSPLSLREMAASNGAYVSEDVTWLLPERELSSAVPTPGDKIEDATGTVWTILSRSFDDVGRDYLCVCRDLILVNGLRDLVTIYRPTNSKDSSGNRVPSYAAVAEYTNLPARVQEQDGSRESIFGKQGLLRKFTVYLETRVVVNAEDRVVANGVTYQITSYRSPDRIDQLMELDCEVIP